MFQLLKTSLSPLKNVIFYYTLVNRKIQAERTFIWNNSHNSEQTAQVYDTNTDLCVSWKEECYVNYVCTHTYIFSKQKTDSW